jgi:16S rRNA (cytosine967-C5)-methyltransferase
MNGSQVKRSGAPKATARGVAISALVAAESGERANVVVPRLLTASGLDERDKGFATELAYGALRMCRACDWLVGQFARGHLEPRVRAAARAGAYQLAFMRVPAYAAVSATVAEAPRRARPLLNAVLRRVAGLVEAGPVAWPDLGTKLSYPDWIIKRLGEDIGPERAIAALEQMNVAASPSVRPDGYVQDPGSQAVAEYMAGLARAELPGPGLGRVLDLCAAPGGKATLIAGHAPFVVGTDVSPTRAGMVAGNAMRLGIGNLSVVVADGTEPPFRPCSFAGVLVDAPCTGLGVLRRRPDARWRARPEDPERLAALQRHLLGAAAELVAPGGVLVYSVCTLTKAETVDVDSWLATELPPGWGEVVPPPGPPWEPLGRGAVLLPQAAGTDGMFVLGLRRLGAVLCETRDIRP